MEESLGNTSKSSCNPDMHGPVNDELHCVAKTCDASAMLNFSSIHSEQPDQFPSVLEPGKALFFDSPRKLSEQDLQTPIQRSSIFLKLFQLGHKCQGALLHL